MEAVEDSYTFVAQFSPTPATCTIEERASVDIECVIAANMQTYTRCYSIDCSQSTTCTPVQESGTAVQESVQDQESGRAVQESDTAVQVSAAQETSSTDETWNEHNLHYSTQETEEGNK